MDTPPQVTPPLRVNAPEATLEAAPAPHLRVYPQGDIEFQPVHAPILSPQRAPRIIPDDTEPIPPVAHQKATETPKVPQVHSYNTQSCSIQGQDLMANHV